MSHTITRGARRSEDVLEVIPTNGARNKVKFHLGSEVWIKRYSGGVGFIFTLDEAVAIAHFILDHVEEVPSPKYRLVED